MDRLYLDECVPLPLAPLLTQYGHDVVTAMQLGLRGQNDPFHFKYATEQQRIFVTTNQSDFRLLHRFWITLQSWNVLSPPHQGVVATAIRQLDEQVFAQAITDHLTHQGLLINAFWMWNVATAANVTIAEIDEIVEPGVLDPEAVVTPGIFVHRLVHRKTPMRKETVLNIMRTSGRMVKVAETSGEGGRGLSPELMALRAARLLQPGQYVNLGIGLPTLVSDFIPDGVTLHAENGVLGYGRLVQGGEEDIDLYNASSQLVTLQPGASFFHSADAFVMARGAHIDTVVLGGFQVAENGDLANWKTPSMGAGAVGGAMDLAVGARTLIIVMFHTTKSGESKLLSRCTYPLTAPHCVSWIVTNLALIQVDSSGFVLKELAPGVSVEEVRAATAASLRVASDLREMEF